MQHSLTGPPDELEQIQDGLTMPQVAFRDPLRKFGFSFLLRSCCPRAKLDWTTHAIHTDCPSDPFVRFHLFSSLQPFPHMWLEEGIHVKAAVRAT